MDKLDLTEHQIRRLRLRAQRLLDPGAGRIDPPDQVLTDLCGVQAQDLPAGRLSIRARSAGLTDVQIEAARVDERSIAWVWCLRGTLHLVSADDARWLVPCLGPDLILGDQARLYQLGWDEALAEKGLFLLEDTLRDSAGLSRREIIQLLKENNLPWEGQAPVHLLFRAALKGDLLRGRFDGREDTYVPFKSWLGELEHLPRPTALSRLAVRYLSAYAPAAPEDLAKWSGIKIGEARQAFELIDDQLAAVRAFGQPSWLLESQLPWLDEIDGAPPCVCLLPRFDTYLLGYANRDWMLAPNLTPQVFHGGIIKPTFVVDGQVRGTWSFARRKNSLEIAIEPFEPLDKDLLPLIESEAQDIARYLDIDSVGIKY